MNRPARFRTAEVARALKAVQKGGVAIGAVDILPDGGIRITARDGSAPIDDYDGWKARREARRASR